jgi:putative ABC transport system permease protein
MFVSGTFFQTLGVPALIGRTLTPADHHRGCGSAGAVIGYGFWQREYGGTAAVLGREIQLDGHPFPIIGITPQEFYGIEVGKPFAVAIPLCSQAMFREGSFLDRRDAWWLGMMGRLRPGVSLAGATSYLESVWPGVLRATISPNYRPETAKEYLRLKIHAQPGGNGYSSLRSKYQDPSVLLLSIAGLVLLIACANVANLLLTRATGREREIAIRLAVGASRSRLMCHMLTESLLLATLGSAAGIVLAQWLSRYVVMQFTTRDFALSLDLSLDVRTLGFIVLLTIAVCLLFGLFPALSATATKHAGDLKAAGRGLTASRERFAVQRALLICQICLSLVLLVASLLFVRSFRNLITLDPGFRESGMLIADAGPTARPPAKSARLVLKRRLLERVRGIPGVDAAAEVRDPPLYGGYWNDNIDLDDAPLKGSTGLLANFNRVSDGYFQTMGTPFIGGRDFNDHDTLHSRGVAIVDQTFVTRFLHGHDPIGGRFHVEVGPGEAPRSYEIVGVVKNAVYADLGDKLEPTVLVSAAQDPDPRDTATLVVHSNLSLFATVSALRRALLEVNPDLTLEFHSFNELVHDSVRREDILAKISGFFGLIAALLATIGLYGVFSYVVTQRRNEIGIRLAVGADRRRIFRMIFRESAILFASGIVAGTILSLAGGRAARSLLFNLQPNDPLTILCAIAALGGATLLATAVPAYRAANVDPMTVLRDE